MLILHEGGFTSLAHKELISNVKKSIEKGRKCFLFVPEQQTVTAEKEMCNILSPESALCFEVTNFTRFTNTVFRTLGGISGEYVTSAKKSLIMWGTLTELAPMLTLTKGSKSIGAGVVSKALSAIGELSSLGIRPADMSAIEKLLDTSNQRLKNKLSDLSMIYALYKDKLAESYSDMSDDLKELAQKLREAPEYLANTDIYIEGFTSFTEPQYALISAMIALCPITVSLAMPKTGRECFEYTELSQTERRLISIADNEKADKKLYKPDAKDQSFEPVLSEICDLLWRLDGILYDDSLQKINNNRDILRVFEANTPFDECDFISSDIKRRVMLGAHYRDFAVIVRSLGNYSGILDTSFEKAGIPAFMSKKESILSFEAIKMILTAYSVVDRGFKTSDVMTYAKCGMSGISKDECDLFELYVSKWKIDGVRFTDGVTWNMNPDGYSKMKDGDAERLILINDIRSRLIDPLVRFNEDTREASTVREQAEALLDFLIEIGLEASLKKRAKELAALGENEAARRNLRLWQIICDSLDTVVDTLADTKSDRESFINQLSVVFEDTTIGSIPSNIDEVSIGQADMIRLSDKKHVYLVGVNRGEFPMTVSDNSYFTDRDKAALEKLGLAIKPDLEVKNAREFYSFSRAFASAKESVTILYAKKTASLGASLPAEVIERIAAITGNAVRPQPLSELSADEKIFYPEGALENLGRLDNSEKEGIKRALLNTGYKDVLKISDGKLRNDEVQIDEKALAIIIGKNIYLSQSKIDKFLKCPFKYFSSTYLKLNEIEEAEINQLVVGNFIHSVLESFFNSMIHGENNIAQLTAQERIDLTEKAARDYVARELGGGYGSARTEVIIDRVLRIAKPIVDGLCDEFANCQFTPVCCELHIDGYTPDTPNSIVYETNDKKHKVFIDGFIDRVDTFTNENDVYVRVIDYKTGMKKFSLDDVKEGDNLQMLLYLKAVIETDTEAFKEKIGAKKDSKLIPAGIVYVKTSVADVTIKKPSDELALEEVKANFERLGASLNEEASLSAMNPDYIPSQKSKSGAVSALTYTMEDWKRINEEMESVILSVTDEITKGQIAARAKNKASSFSPCRDCQYKYLCRSSEE